MRVDGEHVRDPYLADPETGLHTAGWYDSTGGEGTLPEVREQVEAGPAQTLARLTTSGGAQTGAEVPSAPVYAQAEDGGGRVWWSRRGLAWAAAWSVVLVGVWLSPGWVQVLAVVAVVLRWALRRVGLAPAWLVAARLLDGLARTMVTTVVLLAGAALLLATVLLAFQCLAWAGVL